MSVLRVMTVSSRSSPVVPTHGATLKWIRLAALIWFIEASKDSVLEIRPASRPAKKVA